MRVETMAYVNTDKDFAYKHEANACDQIVKLDYEQVYSFDPHQLHSEIWNHMQ